MRRSMVLAASIAVAFLGVTASSVRTTQAASLNNAAPTGEPGQLVNGDFETGSFVAWSPHWTTNGQMRMAVVRFDTDNDGVATSSAEFVVGQEVFEPFDVQRGGGIFQEVVLGRGDLAVSASVASSNTYAFCNGDGGTTQLLVDGAVVDQHRFGEMCGPTAKFARLAASLALKAAGTHDVRFLITRGSLPSVVSNYIDDVVVSGGATVKPVIGSPAATPTKPAAGKRLSVSFPVTRSDNGAALTSGAMSCDPRVRGKAIRHAESFANGIARVSFTVPRTAKGKSLTVKLTITAENELSATRVATFRIR